MAKSIFENTYNNKSKKKKDEDDIFQRVSEFARTRDSVGIRSAISPDPIREPVVKSKETPTVSSSVGKHTSDYGKYSGSKAGSEKEEEPEKKWWEKLGDQDEHINFWANVLAGEWLKKANDIYDLKFEADKQAIVDLANAEYADRKASGKATGWDTVGHTAMSGLTGITSGLASTLDFLSPTEFLGKYDPFTWLSDDTKRYNTYWNAKRAASLEDKGNAASIASDVGVGVIEAIPAAVAAYFSGGTSLLGSANTLSATGGATATSWLGKTFDSARTVVGDLLKNPAYYTSASQTLGRDYEEAKATGASDAQAAVYAIITTGLNAGVEVSGGIETMPKAIREGGKPLLQWVTSIPEEGIEEVVQRYISGSMQKTIYDPDKEVFSWENEDAIIHPASMAKEFAMGSAVGSILGGGQVSIASAVNAANNKKLKRIGTDYVESAEELINEGLSFGENTDAYKTAKELQERMARGEEVSSTDLGRLVAENESAIRTEQRLAVLNTPVVEAPVDTSVDAAETPTQSRMQTIQTRLAESGMDTAQAETVAQSLNRILSGDHTVTNKDKDVLSAGNTVARAIFEEETGTKLPASNSSTRKVVADYITKTAISQQGQETATTNVIAQEAKPVTNVIEAYQNQQAQAEKVEQLKDTLASPVSTSASADVVLRQAAQQAAELSKMKTATSPMVAMESLGTKGQTAYQKHIGNAKNTAGFNAAFQRYYDAGQIGVPFESIKTAYDGEADRTVLFEAYSAGQNDATLTRKANTPAQNKNARKGKNKPSMGKGRFYDSRTSEGKSNSDGKTVTKQVIKALELFAKTFNVDIELLDTIADKNGNSIANGYYKDGKVYLAADSWNPLMTVLKHEVTHHIQRVSPEQYKAFKDYVMKAFYDNSQEAMNAEIQRRIDLANYHGHKLTRSQAMDEIVADATERFLTDRDSIDALVRENRSLGETILNAIRDVLHKIEAALKGVTPKSLDFMNVEQLRQAEKMWMEALASTVEGHEIGINFAEVTESSTPVWSLKSMKFDLLEGQMQRDLVEHDILTVEESQHLMTEISNLIDKMSPFAHIVDMNEEYSKDNRPFAVYKPNSDPLYKVSLDFSTLCKKRLMTQFVIESLQTKLGKALSAKEQMAIRSKLEEYAKVNEQIQVACALCYVEARRLKAPDQINRFLEDRTTYLTDYFGKKNKEYKQTVEDMASKMKVEMGYKADTKLKDMKPSDKKKVNEAKQKMMKEYTPTAEEQKIIERANAIDNAEFLSKDGLTRLNINEPAIYDAFVSHVRNATKSKALEGGVPYYYGDSKSVSDSLIEAMNAENGLRHQSWSDFEIVHLLDTIAAVIDLSVRKAKVQSYTKVPAFVHVNGNTGMMINLSLIPSGKNGMKDGKLDFSPTEGMDYSVAVELRNQYHKTTGTIAIGIDDTQIDMLLNDPTIDYVIPYHTSGMNAQLRKMAGIAGWLDYESYQSEKEIKGAKQGNCPDELWHKKPDFSEWFDTSKLDMSKSGVEIMREAAGRYLVMCEERGLHPKFSNTKKHTDFSKHENYWKLLIDRKMVDGDGNIIIQQTVRPNFDFAKISEIVDTEIKNYDPTLLDSINEMVMNEWENGGIKQREAELLADEKAKKKAEKKAAKVANGLMEQVVVPEQAQKNTIEDDGGNPYQGKSLTEDSVVYSYDFLVNLPDMEVKEMPSLTEVKTGDKVDQQKAINLGMENAEKVGRKVSQGVCAIENRYTGREIHVSQNGLGHSLDAGNIGRLRTNARLTAIGGDIIRNAVPLNALKNTNPQAQGTYAMAALLGSGDRDVVAIVTVEQHTDRVTGIDYVDIAHSINGRLDAKKEGNRSSTRESGLSPATATFHVSIADFLEIVNNTHRSILSEDVLAHFGVTKSPDGYYSGETLFQYKDSDESLEIVKQIAEVEHKAKAVTTADIMKQKLNDIAKTDEEKTVVRNYQNAMKKLADYEKELAVYDATKAEHPKGRSIYTDASGKVKKSGVKYSAAEKAEIQRKVELWKRNLKDIERKEAFKRVLKREKAKMAEHYAKEVSDLRSKYDKRLSALRDQRDAKVEAEKQKMRDYKQYQRDSKEYKALQGKLEKDVKWLDERLRHSTESKHIPDKFRGLVARFLGSIDFTTTRMDKRIAETGAPTKKNILLLNMMEEYQKIATSEDSDLMLTPIEEGFYETIKETFEGGKKYDELTYEELEMVYDIIRYIKAGIASANKVFNENIKETVSQLGDDAIFEMGGKKARKEFAGLANEADKLLFFDNVTPGDMFHRFGGVMETMYKEIRKGFNKHIENVRTAIDFTQQLIEGHEEDVKKWSNTATVYNLANGNTIELTQAQVMSLYVLMKRDQARTHIIGNEDVIGSGIVPSGVVIEEAKSLSDLLNKEQNAVKKENRKDAEEKRKKKTIEVSRKISEIGSHVTMDDVMKIVNTLDEDQRTIADGIVKFFTTKCADWGNETSMKLFDIKKFTEKHYFPIKSSDAFLAERFDSSGFSLIKNLGMTKNTVVNATNPIVLDDIFDVLTDHANKMSMYNALVVPLTDFTRVYNYKHKGENGELYGVKDVLQKAYGSLAGDYVTQFMKDVNKQANALAAESFGTKALSTYKKVKIGANLRVLAQQPTAIVRAADMVDPKYITKGLKQKANYEEMLTHSEIAYWKSLGFYQTDMSRNMRDILMDNESTLDKITMSMYGKADDWAWAHLWNAIKLEQADAHPDMDKTSSEFMDLVSNRFEEVVDRTQVVDSVFHRSQLMRSPSLFNKMVTAFMAEPTKSYNMLMTDLSDSIKSKNYTQFKRSVVTFVANGIIVSMAAAIVDAFRDDEDEDKEGNKRGLGKKYIDAVGSNVLDNINPATLAPYLKDVWSVVAGFDVGRMDMAAITQFMKVARKWTTGKHTLPYLIKETAFSLAELGGIPLKNATRDLDGLVRTAGNMFGGHHFGDYWFAKLRYNISNADNRSVFYKFYTDALLDGDEKAADKIYKDMVLNGIPSDNIISKGYQVQKKAAFSEAQKLIDKGKTDEAKDVIRKLAKANGKKYTDLWKTFRNTSTDEPEKTYDFDDLKKAVKKGKDTDAIEDYLTEYGGWSEDAVDEAIKRLTEKYH